MDHGGKVAEGPVEQENVLRRGPLLRPVHGRGAVRAGEGVVHVRGGHVPNVPNGRIEGCGVDSGQVEQARSSRPDFASPFVQQPDPKGLGHPGPRVVGRAPPHADQDARYAAAGRGEDQLSRPPGGGPLGVATPGRDQVQSGGAGHLHHAEPPPGRVHDRVLGLHRITQRPGDPLAAALAPERGHQRVERSLATVRHRDGFGPGPGRAAAPPRLDGPGRLPGRERSLELVGGDQDPHEGQGTIHARCRGCRSDARSRVAARHRQGRARGPRPDDPVHAP